MLQFFNRRFLFKGSPINVKNHFYKKEIFSGIDFLKLSVSTFWYFNRLCIR